MVEQQPEPKFQKKQTVRVKTGERRGERARVYDLFYGISGEWMYDVQFSPGDTSHYYETELENAE